MKHTSGEWYIVDEDCDIWGCPYCQLDWQFTTGTQRDNSAYYCPRCGKRLIDNIPQEQGE